MSRPACYALVFICWQITIIGLTARGQSLQPRTHPNHYILLIDASGSTVQTEVRRTLYEEVLTDRLLKYLYRDGFGQVVPPYDPQQDYLTLHHFGVVTGEVETAFSRLGRYDLLADFIHPKLIRQGGVKEADLKPELFPAQVYRYTILTWAKQLALHHSRPTSPADISHRTFIIMIHDGRPNDHSVKAELEMVRLWSGDNYRRVEPLVTSIDKKYQFTNVSDKPETYRNAGRDEALEDTSRFFIEVYEITSTAQAEWETQGVLLQPLTDLRLRWTKESGETPQGILAAKLSEEFAAWLKSADGSEVSLAAGSNRQSGTGAELEMPVVFEEALTCAPQTLDVSLNILMRRTDPLLGTRQTNYTYQRAVLAPPPLRCTAVFAVSAAAVGIIAVLALLAVALYLHYRFRTTHLEIEIPGTLAPIRLERHGQREGRAPVVPQIGLEALSLKLPGRLKQWLFYQGATITLGSEGDEELLNWSDDKSTTQIQLPLAQERILAHWRSLPAEPTTVTISFQQGSQRADVNLTYPRALAEPARSTVMDENTIFVALDLGSESMAAYYETTRREGGMIKLQVEDVAKKLLSGGSGATESPQLLMEEIEGRSKLSPRLWNRISFRDNAQPQEPEDDHATLCFVSSPSETTTSWEVSLEQYEKSLFNFFHTAGGWPLFRRALPNPKILFQQQTTKILASFKIKTTDGGRVRLSPEMLIKHLTLQVLNNFVLNSPELKSLENYSRQNIHLTITVPNVYSLSHAESIKEFVRRNASDLAGVEVLSESDAVAYYALKLPDKNDPPALERFKQALRKERERRKELCLVTIDVGKGTTDLSCILLREPSGTSLRDRVLRRTAGNPDKQIRHSVQGKTGKSSGGSDLSYIFAKYYDNCLREAVENIQPGTSPNIPFGFLREPPLIGMAQPFDLQLKAVSKLEKLIERVKRSMTEDYEIDERLLSQDEQREMLKVVVDQMLESLVPEWTKKSEEEMIHTSYWPLRELVINSLVLPPKLEKSGRISLGKLSSWLKRITSPSGGKPAQVTAATMPRPSRLTADLKRDLEKYVSENVDDLLDNLKNLVKEHQAVSKDRGNIDRSAFVVVSGQASQFRPLRASIKLKCKDMGIEDERMLLMEGIASKEACCKGVVNFWADSMLLTNPRELHGTYGCMGGEGFKAFDMRKIKNGGSHTISFRVEGRYYVIFTPRSYEEVLKDPDPPTLGDDATALIDVFIKQSEFTIEYDPDRLELKINGKRLTISSFGDVGEEIYKKVWPEILEPHKD